ncbi:MAG: hypothetical protein AAGM38_02955 [Pseudomonadota bacterium]
MVQRADGRDKARGKSLLSEACKNGIDVGCFNFGVALRDGLVGPRDVTAAIELWMRSCDRGYGAGCREVGLHHHQGDGVSQDHAQAAQLYAIALTIAPGYEYALKGLERVAP